MRVLLDIALAGASVIALILLSFALGWRLRGMAEKERKWYTTTSAGTTVTTTELPYAQS